MKSKLKEFLMHILFFLIIFMAIYNTLISVKEINGDNYFMFEHAKRILSEGFTDIDPLSMHEGFNFVYPQWLFAVIIYLIKVNLGNDWIMYFMFTMHLLVFFFLYKVGSFITNKNINTSLFVVLSFLLFALASASVRPFIITILILLVLIYTIEKYIRIQNAKLIIAIPILSILLINFHNSLWIAMVLVFMCYIGEWVLCKIIKGETNFNIKWMLIELGLTLVSALVNPYGYKYIVYIIQSMNSLGPLYPYISELKSPSITHSTAFYYIIAFDTFILLYTTCIAKKNIPYRYLLMFFGFAIMTLTASRNMLFFTTLGQIPVIYSSQFLKPLFKTDKYIKKIALGIILLMVWVMIISIDVDDRPDTDEYQALDWISQVTDEKGTMLTSFNTGSYAEYKGFKSYIDARAEIFGIANNKKTDIASEYVDLIYNDKTEDYFDFMEKYKFDYAIIETKHLNDVVKSDAENYDLIYGKGRAKLYKRKSTE